MCSPCSGVKIVLRKFAATPQAIARLQAAINTLEKKKKETEEIFSRADQAIKKSAIEISGSPPFNCGHWRRLQSRIWVPSLDALVASLAPSLDAFAVSLAPTLEAEP